ncbi:hypothetical protein OSCI_20005 [Kamptonema sp. PCC 6506]|nr:hypothetical protein OSCI_20005 [Kamptonema sp. PCC 6506]
MLENIPRLLKIPKLSTPISYLSLSQLVTELQPLNAVAAK